MGAAGGIAAGGSILDMDAKLQSDEAESALNARNAEIARRAAVDAIARGSFDVGMARQEGSRVLSSATAAMGASGFDVQDATGQSVAETTQINTGLASEIIKANALREALGFEAQAQEYDFRKAIADRSAKSGNFFKEILRPSAGNMLLGPLGTNWTKAAGIPSIGRTPGLGRG